MITSYTVDFEQGSYRSGKTGKSQGFWLVREVRKNAKLRGKSGNSGELHITG